MRQPTTGHQLRQHLQLTAEEHGKIRHHAHRDAEGHFRKATPAEQQQDQAEAEQPS